MRRVLVSACLLGDPVRYDGRGSTVADPILARWLDEGRVIRICPEVAGGLPVPRPRAELVRQRGLRVVTEHGVDVTAAFVRGADAALEAARAHRVALAVLKSKSPSCGTAEIYDGSFAGRLIPGMGMTARRLHETGIPVFSEQRLSEADELLIRSDDRT